MSEDVKTPEVEESMEKVFPMSTLVAAIKGGDVDAGLLEMLSFVTQSNVDADLAPVAGGIAKGFIYEQDAKLVTMSGADVAGLGGKVKMIPMAGAELSQAQAVLSKLTELKAENDALKAEVATLTKDKAELAGLVDGLKAKVKVADDANAAGEKKITLAETKIDGMVKKLNQLMEEVDKVKAQGVVVAGGAPAAGGDGAAAAAPAGGDAPSTGGEPEADFGFGSNPFADNEW
jgi:hypothetical protein